MYRIYITTPSACQEFRSDPNPDIEKVHVADRPDLERFFKRRIPDFSNYLPIPYQQIMARVGHSHSLAFGQTAPLASSLVCCIRLLSHPSGQTLSSKDFLLIPSNSSNFSKSIINFRTASPACFTIRPAT